MDILLSSTLPRPVLLPFTEELPAAAPTPVLAEEDAPPVLSPAPLAWTATVFRDEEAVSIVLPALAEEAFLPLPTPPVPYFSARPAVEEEWAAQPVAMVEEVGPVLFVWPVSAMPFRPFVDEELAVAAAPFVLVEEYPPLALPPTPQTRWLMLISSSTAQAPPAVQVAAGGLVILTLPVSGRFTQPLPPVDEEKAAPALVTLTEEAFLPLPMPLVPYFSARPFVDEERATLVFTLADEAAPVLFVWPAPFVQPLPPATEERTAPGLALAEETGPALFVQAIPFVQPRPFADEERAVSAAPVLEEYAPPPPAPQPVTRWLMMASSNAVQAPPAVQVGSGGTLVLTIRTSGRFTQPRPPATEERAAPPAVLVEEYAPPLAIPFGWQAPWKSRQVFGAEEVLVTLVGPPPCTIEGATSFAVLQAGLTSFAVLQAGATFVFFVHAETTAFAFTHADAAAFRTVIIDTFGC